MKIAISATTKNPSDRLDERFGRCTCFHIIDQENDEYDVIVNEFKDAGSGAGIKAAQLVVDSGAQTVITGNCGPKALSVLEAAGIKVITDAKGSVKEALSQFA